MKKLELPVESQPLITESDYRDINTVIDVAKAFTRVTYKFVYIFDFHRLNFQFVSDNFRHLCDENPEMVKKKGTHFFSDYFPEESLEFIVEIVHAVDRFVKDIPVENRLDYVLLFNTYIYNTVFERTDVITHHVTPVKLCPKGNFWLALGTISFPSGNETYKAIIKSKASDKVWIYNTYRKLWQEYSFSQLSDKEKTVIRMAARGLSIKEIAREMSRSIDTVKGYRRSIFRKLNVDSMNQAISFAQSYQLF